MSYYANNSLHGSFNPMDAHLYTVDQLIEFMSSEGLSLQEINQIRNVAQLSHDDFLKMLAAGVCSVDDMRECGVPASVVNTMREKQMILSIQKSEWESLRSSNDPDVIRGFIDDFPESPFTEKARKRLDEITDDSEWHEARSRRTMGAYALYLEDHPEGRHVDEAKKRLRKLQTEEAEITKDLMEDMKSHPWEYPPSTMSTLLDGEGYDSDMPRPEDDDDLPPAQRFISRGLTLRFKTLIENDVIPQEITRDIITAPEYTLPQTSSFNNFPLDRTDVFFLGVPRSGKSTVLSALFYTMYREGRWKHVVNVDPDTHKDPSLLYYQGLLKAVQAHKPPESTATDTISYISMDVPAGESKQYTAHLNFVEISGEAVEQLAQSIMTDTGSSSSVWDELGASNVMRNRNKKILFFLLDYNTIIGNRRGMDVLNQELTLKTALDVLTNDGKGKNNLEGCTMSKVESVAILLTKADLMGTDDIQQRQKIAMEYLKNNFKGFMNTLSLYCKRFDINHNNGNCPLIFTHSAGQFFVGNTMQFDERDTLSLAERIEDLAPYKKGGLF